MSRLFEIGESLLSGPGLVVNVVEYWRALVPMGTIGVLQSVGTTSSGTSRRLIDVVMGARKGPES